MLSVPSQQFAVPPPIFVAAVTIAGLASALPSIASSAVSFPQVPVQPVAWLPLPQPLPIV